MMREKDLNLEIRAAAIQMVIPIPDPGYEPFVAKVQKAKTRKDKDYFVLRVSVPKNVAQKLDTQPGDYLFFRAKKAEWYHMLDWREMGNAWQMLPPSIRDEIILSGLPNPLRPEMIIPSSGQQMSDYPVTASTFTKGLMLNQIPSMAGQSTERGD